MHSRAETDPVASCHWPRRNTLRRLAAFGLATMGTVSPGLTRSARIELRSAILIGNAAYADARLRNPVNDAQAMDATLRRLGFSTQLKADAGRDEMIELLRVYLRRAEHSDVRLVFFAGHGVQWQGRNYLIPVDATIRDESDLATQSVDLSAIVDRLSSLRQGVNIIIVDACRNNPYTPSLSALADARRLRTRGGMPSPAGGLAPVMAPGGTLIAFSTAPGAIAVDSPEEGNSVYTSLLLERMETPGLTIERLFKEVRGEVALRTEQKQIPWESSSLIGDFCFRNDAAGVCGS